ncbi:MAG TPA: HlyD family secretion protein [Aliidongia sp.]|nr:HlyD family secretion protein [Aliidongia sp.]
MIEFAWRAVAAAVALGMLVIVATRWSRWEGSPGSQITDDAYLQADLTPIASKVSGYLRSLPVQDYEAVHAGQLLAEIVDDDYQAAVAQAAASVEAAEAQAGALKAQSTLQRANIQAADAVVTSTAASLAQNARDLTREKTLLRTGSSSTEAVEKLATAHEQLIAQLAQNRAQADAARRQLEVLTAQRAQAEAAAAAQQASLDAARINLGYTRITAPQEGVIGERQVKPGQYVSIGSQITTLTPIPHVWVVANYKETQLTHMVIGNRARISVDTFPGRTMIGHVLAISPASGAQFALLPPDNATGNYTKVVQRIPVKIVIDDPAGLADHLRPGMSVVAEVDAEDGAGP